MDDYAYSREKCAPAGSNLYYSSLFYENEKKNQLFSIFAFATTLTEIIDRCSDPGLARIKLQWWHEEVERIFNQSARHPVGKDLAKSNLISSLDESLFHQLISYEEQKMDGLNVGTADELLQHLAQGPGLLWKICVEYFGYLHPDTREYAQDTGCILAFFNILQHARRDITYGRLFLPLKDLETAGVSQQHFLDNDSDNTREFFHNQINYLITHINKNFQAFPAEDSQQHLHVLIMNRLQLGLCNAVLSDNCNLLTRKTSLTPLQKLWIAWRTKLKT